MRKTSTLALVAAGCALIATGPLLAEDAPQQHTRGSIVFAAGDRAHGYLRGGETNALHVHLVKGDVYSFSVTSNRRGDPLVMHLTFEDPAGHEITGQARTAYRNNGKRITVGPYRAPATGTYTIELLAQTWFDGDYWATSTLRGARKSVVRLPADGAGVPVDVSAGSTMRLSAKGVIPSLLLATPNAQPTTLAGDDPLLATLRATGIASAETGTYQFGAKGLVRLEVTKPRHRAIEVIVPRLPDDPTRLAQFEFALGWNPRQQPAQSAATADPSSTPPVVGGPVAVDVRTATSGSTSTLFVGGAVTAAALFVEHDMPSVDDPANPPVDPPVAPPKYVVPERPTGKYGTNYESASTAFGTPIRLPYGPEMPSFGCVGTLGGSAFAISGYVPLKWRDTPWNSLRSAAGYPKSVQSRLLPTYRLLTKVASVENGDGSDPFVRRTFELSAPRDRNPGDPSGPVPATQFGTVTTTMRYFIDGHPAASLLASGGDTSVTWTVSGSGTIDGTPWTIDGAWTMVMTPVEGAPGITGCVLLGREKYVAGDVYETVDVPMMELRPLVWGYNPFYKRDMGYFFDTVGTIRNTLSARDVGLDQSFERELAPAVPWPTVIDRWKVIDTKTITSDPSTPGDGVEDDESYVLFLC